MNQIFKSIFILSSLFFAFTLCKSDDNLVVTTNSGKVLGTTTLDRKGNKVYSFQSIPFAKPPVGDLRFKDPKPIDPWKNVLNATKPSPSCPQDNNPVSRTGILGQEDCLYLNVYTPQIPNANNSRNGTLLPVMVFIHGGAFRAGTSSEFGPKFLLPEKVVLATMNYRLGFLGFLNFKNQNLSVPGNAALKDQVLALKWIKDNIKYFGGDPKSVTIFGESAGSGSVHLLVLSPMAKGLFHKAIAESGCALNLWTQGKKDNGKTLGKALNISTDNDTKLLEDLRKVPVEKIIQIQYQISPDANVSTQWDASLVVETQTNSEAFLPNEPINLIKSGNYNAVPLMLGYNSQEGLLVQLITKAQTGQFLVIKDYERYLPYILKDNNNITAKLNEVAEKVKKFYDSQNATKITPSVNFMTDTMFFYRIYKSVLEHSKIGKAPVYFYRFSADTKLNRAKRSDPDLINYPGAAHGDDLGYLFWVSDSIEIKPGSIEELSLERMVRLWTNFAKFGNPTPKKESLLDNQIWEPFLPNKTFLFEIANNLSVSTNPDIERIKFWDKIYETNNI